MSYTLNIQDIREVTHDVRQIRLEKPEEYTFIPGQATEVAVDREGWRDEGRPFTFTSLDTDPYLEFVIKIYPDHGGVTDQIGTLSAGDRLIIGDPWGTITYKGEGTFLAGGAGVTPFIAILRDLHRKGEIGNNRLIFSNKTERDVILKEEFRAILGDRFVSVITEEKPSDDAIFLDGVIDKTFLKSHVGDFDQVFYVCGPGPFNKGIMAALEELGARPEGLIFEE
ncbi:oxidoreductase fad/nad(p)-binding domain protein [Marinobacter santoriniensis NKSG1]|uniref:Oxidoreductase fad/nad(P)-binding domain protein n=1 Tax=Marinobacter santoriniensis NKSG1 TaxID=1288826 RepID=M7CNI4_9GAMM|nr:FAD-binding oxidoreductase [Marinobacter santoriniensis]EMP54734.1 oxidoreductase fad/nad(p)-binding domain protein [Marinobacter santoriniensis NKSG1]